MARMQLSSKTRTDFRKSVTKQLRRDGAIPATVYGKDVEPVSISVPLEEFNVLLKTPGGRLSIIELQVEGAKSKKPLTVMIQEVQRDPLTKGVIHLDLHQVKMDVEVTAHIPIRLIGEAPGIKMGGILEHFVREIDIKALPDRVPSHIDVDVSGLDLGDAIHVSDIALPEGAELIHTSSESVIATCRQPLVRTEEAVAATEVVGETTTKEAEAGAAEAKG
jgi:large subunit ribosomal protein L25